MGQTNYPQPPIFCNGNPTSLGLKGVRGQFAFDESNSYAQYVWAPDGAWHAMGGGGGGGASTIFQNLTSGAAPVDVVLPTDDSWQTIVARVTTGGTAGGEVVNVPSPTLDANNYNTRFFNRQVIVVCVSQTDPADFLQVTTAPNAPFINDNTGTVLAASPDGTFVKLDYEEANAQFVWGGYAWLWQQGNNDTAYTPHNLANYRFPMPKDGIGGQVALKGSTTAGDVAWSGITGGVKTVATLPSALDGGAQIRWVGDALAPALGAPVVGGGAANVLVFSNSADWIVIALL